MPPVSFDITTWPLWVLAGLGALVVGVPLGSWLLVKFGVIRRRESEKSGVDLTFMTVEDLNAAIDFTGFIYDSRAGVFTSTMYPWQRNFGYCRFYDDAMSPISLIIDSEPVYFEYGGKCWLIELWKGQYGMTTGGEVGVYCTEDPDAVSGDYFTMYRCAADEERLLISQTLYKNGKPLYSIRGLHWWLTGFVLGEFSEPWELSMRATLTFPTVAMRNAFVGGLRKAGYTEPKFQVRGLSVTVHYDTPYTPAPITRIEVTDSLMQAKNEALCVLYQEITGTTEGMPGKLNLLRETNRPLFDQALHFGKQRELFDVTPKMVRKTVRRGQRS